MNDVVRESLDGEKETLEQLLYRVMNDFKKPKISWLQFLGHFSKRGRLQGYNELDVSPSKEKVQFLLLAEQGLAQGGQAFSREEHEEKVKRMQANLAEKLDYKEELVPKDGKGKYNITVPVAFEFLNKTKEAKTIRERKVAAMIAESHSRDQEERCYQFKANEIPRSTQEPLYQRLLATNEARRQEVKRMSLAITKQREKPFSFYLRDQENAKRPRSSHSELHPPFKAAVIPWRVRAPLYQEMVERAEYSREQRIKRNAEVSLSLSKLPPRMQEYEEKKKQQAEAGLAEGAANRESQSADRMFSFQPPKAKPVPDFKRLQKQFQQNLEDVKREKNQASTVPEPFHFHNPKPTASMRRYLDSENQMINPTMKKRARSSLNGKVPLSPSKQRDNRENPALTSKFSAYVEQRRRNQESKKTSEECKNQDQAQRHLKQNRLA